jgi:cation:H+ antiporter
MVWVIFLLSSIVIVIAAIHLANNADVIAIRTGLGGALIGILLLASTTSLPEILTLISSISQGTPNIAAGNLLGSNMFNIVLLAIIDMAGKNERVLRKAALKHALTGSLAVFMIGLVVLFLIVDTDLMIGWIGVDSITLVLVYIAAIYLIRQNSQPAVGVEETIPESLPTLRRAAIGFTLAAVALVIATPILVDASAQIAEITGLGTSFIGTTLVAVVTSLPELVICIAAIKIGAHDMAIGNLFGSNMFNMFILGATDIFYIRGRFLAALDSSFILIGILGLLMTTIGLISNLVRFERRVGPFEIDSVLLLLMYVIGLWLLYSQVTGLT